MMTNAADQRGKPTSVPHATGLARWRSAGLRAALFVLLWWMLTDGAVDAWPFGVPVVALATGASIWLLPPASWSLWGVVRFGPFFLWRSLVGGVDVAWRALHPRLPVSPALRDYPWRLPPGLPRVFMANAVSLLPGTLSVELAAESLRVHVLDARVNQRQELEDIERRVGAIFDISFSTTSG